VLRPITLERRDHEAFEIEAALHDLFDDDVFVTGLLQLDIQLNAAARHA